MPVAMTTSFESEPDRTDPSTEELPTIPTIQKMGTWDEKVVLRWIQQRTNNILQGDSEEKFNEAYIPGCIFLVSDLDFFQKRCGLSAGISLLLDNLVKEVKQEGKLSDQTVGGKRKGDETDPSQLSVPLKRIRLENPLLKLAIKAREQRKRIKEMITYINGSSDQHSNSAETFPGAVDKLSDPTFECTLAFPFVGFEAPVRFKVDKGDWQYEGREKFKDLLQALKRVRKSESYTTAWLYGTQGYGKSHLLAALVCYLVAHDERVIYIPDCRALLEDPVRYVQAVLLFTWADDIATQEEIMTLDTEKRIENFFESQGNIIIFIDQRNALKDPTEEMKHVKSWLTRLAFGHKKVFSSSANDANYHEEIYKEENPSVVVDVYGGLERVEMDQWWKRHKIDMGDYEQSDVEDVTGRIPLLLDKCVVDGKIDLTVAYLRDIYDKAAGFVQEIRDKTTGHPLKWQWYLKYVKACIYHKAPPAGKFNDLIDHRYFYQVKRRGGCACGLARNAVADQLLKEGENFETSLPPLAQ